MNHNRVSTRRARGLTFIEVIVAAALLAGLASVVMGAVSFMETAAARERHRLNAMEVAHRIIAQYLDNPDILPDSSLPIQQGDTLYKFTLREEVMVQDEGADQALRRRTGKLKSQLSPQDQLPALLNRLTVQVFLADAGSPVIDSTRPVIELVRMYNPMVGDEDVILRNLLKLVDQVQREEAARESKPGKGGGR